MSKLREKERGYRGSKSKNIGLPKSKKKFQIYNPFKVVKIEKTYKAT